MKQKTQIFLEKFGVKTLIIVGIPTIISEIGVLVSLNNISKTVKFVLVILNIVLLVVFLVALVKNSRKDAQTVQTAQTVGYLKKELEVSNGTVTVYKELFENWAKTIYKFAEAVKEGRVTNLSWDKYSYYECICKACCDMVKRYCNTQENHVSVNFIEYRIDQNGEEIIEMVADSNPTATKPKAYQREQKLSESKYYYAELLRKKSKGVKAAENNKEIQILFREMPTDTEISKYTQYIAISIYCEKNKPLGIFEVITEYNCIIEPEKNLLENFAEDKVTPYSNSILLVDKLHKGLYATPK